MLDPILRRTKDRIFDPLAHAIAGRVSPNAATGFGFLLGTACAGALARGWWGWGFGLWALNRIFDALDGAIARMRRRQTDLGGYLDLMSDFVVYTLIPIGVVLGVGSESGDVWALAVLLGTYYVNAASWMFLSAILEKREHDQASAGHQTVVVMPAGVVGGTETMAFYTLFIVLPVHFAVLAFVMAGLVALGALQRGVWAVRNLR